MSVTINGIKYYRTMEVCRLVGISKPTLMRWYRNGVINIQMGRDMRGWRLFSEADVRIIESEVNFVRQTVGLAR
jgi:excisionase family DNA binding protein